MGEAERWWDCVFDDKDDTLQGSQVVSIQTNTRRARSELRQGIFNYFDNFVYLHDKISCFVINIIYIHISFFKSRSDCFLFMNEFNNFLND